MIVCVSNLTAGRFQLFIPSDLFELRIFFEDPLPSDGDRSPLPPPPPHPRVTCSQQTACELGRRLCGGFAVVIGLWGGSSLFDPRDFPDLRTRALIGDPTAP